MVFFHFYVYWISSWTVWKKERENSTWSSKTCMYVEYFILHLLVSQNNLERGWGVGSVDKTLTIQVWKPTFGFPGTHVKLGGPGLLPAIAAPREGDWILGAIWVQLSDPTSMNKVGSKNQGCLPCLSSAHTHTHTHLHIHVYYTPANIYIPANRHRHKK